MKKLLSVFLAVIMIFSCCTLAVNALYLENSIETTYVDDLKPKESLSNVKGITYEGIIGENGLFTEEEFRGRYNKQAISELSGNDFIDALSYVKTKSEDKTETVALKDKNGVETGKYVIPNIGLPFTYPLARIFSYISIIVFEGTAKPMPSYSVLAIFDELRPIT